MRRVIKSLYLVATLLGIASSGAQAASAVAMAELSDGISVAYGWEDHAKALGAAKKSAIETCVDSAHRQGNSGRNCHIVLSNASAGYWAIYNRADGGIAVGFSPRSQQEATNAAYAYCASKSQCDETANHVWYDNGKGTLPAGADSGTFTTYCSGNQCTRRYESGRVVHFTACMNPSTHQPFNNLDGSCSGFDMTNHSLND